MFVRCKHALVPILTRDAKLRVGLLAAGSRERSRDCRDRSSRKAYRASKATSSSAAAPKRCPPARCSTDAACTLHCRCCRSHSARATRNRRRPPRRRSRNDVWPVLHSPPVVDHYRQFVGIKRPLDFSSLSDEFFRLML